MSAEDRPAPNSGVAMAIVTSALFLLWLAWGNGLIVAVVVMVGIFVHEWGHALAMQRAGCGPVRIMFIPFLGGLAIASKPAPTEITGVMIALAGPALGILMVLPPIGIFHLTGDDSWLVGAFFITILNLLNLFPAPPLDGSHVVGPVLARVHPNLERWVAVALGAVAVLWAASGGSYIIAGLIAFTTFNIARMGIHRHYATPLQGGDTALALGLYSSVVGLCLLAVSFVSSTLGERNPLALLQRVLIGG